MHPHKQTHTHNTNTHTKQTPVTQRHTHLVLHGLHVVSFVVSHDDAAWADGLVVVVAEVLNLALLMSSAMPWPRLPVLYHSATFPSETAFKTQAFDIKNVQKSTFCGLSADAHQGHFVDYPQTLITQCDRVPKQRRKLPENTDKMSISAAAVFLWLFYPILHHFKSTFVALNWSFWGSHVQQLLQRNRDVENTKHFANQETEMWRTLNTLQTKKQRCGEH